MAYLNSHYLKLRAGYLFPEIGRRVRAFAAAHPDAKIIRMGIGDVTEPLAPAIVAAMHQAVDEMGRRDTFRGYGPEQGYEFLREAISWHDFRARGCAIEPDEIFISDGSKCDTGNFLDILAAGSAHRSELAGQSAAVRRQEPQVNSTLHSPPSTLHSNVIAVTDPVYPVYVDTNVMHGNTGPAGDSGEFAGLVYLPATAANHFSPDLPDRKVDVIYLCSPNNPTGAALDRATLARWVAYAKANDALILFDAAYEAYIADPALPHSIYEIPGARDVAVEFRSFSKLAGFTGTRCAFTVVPKTVTGLAADGSRVDLHRLWLRRQTTKFNGVSYLVQRGAAAVYSPAGQQEIRATIDFYMGNAKLIREAVAGLGLPVYGGVNAPYVWAQTPAGLDSWACFDKLLSEAHVVVTPGSGFGRCGEGYVRISGFNSRENVVEAMSRLKAKLK